MLYKEHGIVVNEFTVCVGIMHMLIRYLIDTRNEFEVCACSVYVVNIPM